MWLTHLDQSEPVAEPYVTGKRVVLLRWPGGGGGGGGGGALGAYMFSRGFADKIIAHAVGRCKRTPA